MIKLNFLKIEFSQNRVYGLDLLRALAIFFVVFGHGIHIFSDPMIKQTMDLFVFDGVSIFFVLSGFLIGGILIKTIETKPLNTSSLMEFWKRRWFRTLPNYMLILTITYIALGNINALGFIKYLLFIQNFSVPHPPFFPEAWSLSIEEWFYLLIPIGIFFILKSVGSNPKRSVLTLAVSIIIASICIRYYKYYANDIETVYAWDHIFRKQVITRMDSIMYGVLGAYLNYYHSNLWTRHKKGLLLSGLTILLIHKIIFLVREPLDFEFNIYYCVYSFSVSSLATLLLLPFLSNYKQGKSSISRIITVISLISYSMYLINFSLVQIYFIPLFMSIVPVSFSGILLEIYTYIIYWVFTIVGSIILFKYYEAPFTRLRDKKFF